VYVLCQLVIDNRYNRFAVWVARRATVGVAVTCKPRLPDSGRRHERDDEWANDVFVHRYWRVVWSGRSSVT